MEGALPWSGSSDVIVTASLIQASACSGSRWAGSWWRTRIMAVA
ncbi:hypothetical protein ACFQ0B_21920 [Nonomuraea thailandensis]